jgi:mannose-1-phosphate guanylyltransferase
LHGASVALTTANDLLGLVLAGGDGLRLQALTRALTGRPIPKQYCQLVGRRSMLEATLARIEPLIPPDRTLAIVNRNHLPFATEQLRGLPAANLLVQPRNCDTGPGLLFALLRIARRDPRATLAVFPSDHYIRDDRAFLASVVDGLTLVRRSPEKIVLLGMTPRHAEPGLGYLEIGGAVPGTPRPGVFRVEAFVEKPNRTTAEDIIRRGGLWNSFVMIFRLDTMLALLRRRRPADYEAFARLDEGAYESLAPWNFSRDFLAHVADELLALPVGDVGWSDWGTPEAIEQTLLGLNVIPPWRAARLAEVGT